MVKRVVAVVVVAGLGVLGMGAAQAAGDGPAAHRPAWLHVVNLRAAYQRDVGHVRAGRIGGNAWAIGHRPAAQPRPAGAAPAAPCSEPNCKLVYNGGAVQHHPRLYLLLWGPDWADPAQQATAGYLKSFYQGLGVEPADSWSTITSQYSDGTGFPAFGRSVYVGTFDDTSTPPAGTTNDQFAAEAAAFATRQGLKTGLGDTQIVIATQSGTCPLGFADTGCGSDAGNYCAYHSYVAGGSDNGLTYTNLPYLLDAGASCGESIVSSQYDGFSIVGGHEYAETATDPVVELGWWDATDPSGGEIGDKCAWVYPGTGTLDIGLVALSTGTFAMQPLFSNDTFGTPQQSCPLAVSPDTLTLTSPGNRTTVVDAAVSIKIKAASSAKAALSFSATGLPKGLEISSSGTITGTPAAIGASNVKVAVQDATGAYQSASLHWTVATATGHLTGVKKLCAAVSKSGTASGTKVVISACGSATGEKWTLGSGGSLSADGKCLTDPHSGGAGTGLVIESCANAAGQQWTRDLKGEYVLSLNHLCLTDPGSSTKAGTQLKLDACTGAASQVWSLP